MTSLPPVPCIPDKERTPVVLVLLEIIQFQKERIQALKDEIARFRAR
jgi:hypothetical protein